MLKADRRRADRTDDDGRYKTVLFRCEHPASGLVLVKGWRVCVSGFAATALDSTILDQMHEITERMETELRRDFVNVEILMVCDGIQMLGQWKARDAA